jgi:hypothetical protein
MSVTKKKHGISEAIAEQRQAEIDKVTRKVALLVVLVSVIFFFIKLVFL